MPSIYSVAVFCGSRPGFDPIHAKATRDFGTGLAQAGIRLVYGGGALGLMGELATATLAAGGNVLGVIPEFLTRLEVAHPGGEAMEITDSMHTRKRRMFEESDAFVALPGGLGTFDETIEIITWRQLRLHDKPILICDIAGSARPMVALIDAAIDAGFASESALGLFEVVEGVPDLLARLRTLQRHDEAMPARF